MKALLRRRLTGSFIAALIYALVMYVLIWLVRSGADERFPFIAGLLLLPAAISTFTVIITDPYARDTYGDNLMSVAGVMGAALIVAFVAFFEGAICIAMALPFFVVVALLSIWITRAVLCRYAPERGNQTKLRSAAIIIPLLLIPIDSLLENPLQSASVTTEVIIEGPLSAVWDNTVEIGEITRDEYIFTPSHSLISLPRPIDARMVGTGIGAVRHLRWTDGITFREVITDWETADGSARLGWDFEFDAASIPAKVEAHINVKSAYLDLQRGEYTLTALGPNTTSVRLTTHYQLRTPINAYCEWWGDLFLGDFHKGVLNVIKTRSEGTPS